MCSRFMRSKQQVRHGRLYALSERGFELLLAGYRKSLDLALRHHRTTFAVFVATLVATGYLFAVIPKGFFPQQDTGLIIGTSEAAQDISFAEAVRRQRALADIVLKDPAVATVGMSLGANGTQTPKQRPPLHHPEAAQSARRLGRRGHSAAASAARQGRRCRTLSAGGSGHQYRRAPDAGRNINTLCRTPISTN